MMLFCDCLRVYYRLTDGTFLYISKNVLSFCILQSLYLVKCLVFVNCFIKCIRDNSAAIDGQFMCIYSVIFHQMELNPNIRGQKSIHGNQWSLLTIGPC